MNPLCECTVESMAENNGFCKRHKMAKSDIQLSICQGKVNTTDCGRKHWMMWENGSGGAVAPDHPELNPPLFCGPESSVGMPAGCTGCGVSMPSMVSRVASATGAIVRFLGDGLHTTTEQEQQDRLATCGTCPLNENGTCVGCGCFIAAKVQSRVEQCPAGKWLHAVRERKPIANPIRNLIYHILPIASNDNWKWNLNQLALRQRLFNGKKVLAIAVSGDPVRTVPADTVLEYSASIGLEWTHSAAFQNNSQLREVVTFPWLLQTVASNDPNEVTFTCHAKSVTRGMNEWTERWTKTMYRVCLDDWTSVQNALEYFSLAGAFRRFGQFSMGNNWDYSGTFFWMRHADLFVRNWKLIDQHFAGTETYPGKHFRSEEAACLFGDDIGDLYDSNVWDNLQRHIDVWEAARL